MLETAARRRGAQRAADSQAEAIRALFAQAPAEVRADLALEADNSFSIDSMVMEAWPA